MHRIKQVFSVAGYNFRGWHKNPRIFVTFGLAFVLCFLLSDKAVRFADQYQTTMQIVEPFIWTFGDSNSILLSSLLLIILFADMPFLSSGTPFYLMRINRKIWITGQAVYVMLATFFYMVFILTTTALICMKTSFAGNLWSKAAAILGYSETGQTVALPAFVKTLELSTPYDCMGAIFLLMLLYALFLSFFMLMFNIAKGPLAGVVSVLLLSLFGFLLNPQLIETLFHLPAVLMFRANVAVGWISPLNQATYNMHNFGYDLLPRLWQTYLIFGAAILLCFFISLHSIRHYNFAFMGTEDVN